MISQKNHLMAEIVWDEIRRKWCCFVVDEDEKVFIWTSFLDGLAQSQVFLFTINITSGVYKEKGLANEISHFVFWFPQKLRFHDDYWYLITVKAGTPLGIGIQLGVSIV